VRHCGVIGVLVAAGLAALSSGLVAQPANRGEGRHLNQWESAVIAPEGDADVTLRGAAAWLEAVGRGSRR
jgi:hypothetical protein